MNDLASAAIHTALRGLATRQRTIADNVANVETPGFLAGRVDFEASLASAVAGGDPMVTLVSASRSTAGTLPNGNNVSLDQEVVSLTDTNMRYQLMIEAMNAKFRLLRTAMGTSR